MCSMRNALQGETKSQVIDIIVDFHLQWLHIVNEVEHFAMRINELPRDEIYEAISFTIDATNARLHYFQKYMDKYKPTLSNEYQFNINSEIELLQAMHIDISHILHEKLKCFRTFDSDDEFKYKVKSVTEEFLDWIDSVTDSMAVELTKYVNPNVRLNEDLAKTLQHIINELNISKNATTERMLKNLKLKGRELASMIRTTQNHNLEIGKIYKKINELESQIYNLNLEPTNPARLALEQKKDYLEKRLQNLESEKTSLKELQNLADVHLECVPEDDLCICEDFYTFRIFNHDLPQEKREHLVTELCYVWDLAVFGERSHKSIISILSAADIREEYTDELGTYYIDEHSRKIYKIPDDETLYQLNEVGELVPLTDDGNHVYFYDECGRYFIDSTRQRVYKAYATASEYMLDSSGILLKVKEERDGVVYLYDNYGRYYINDEGKHIYREDDTASEYENDGFGNLVRIRSHLDMFELCPDDAKVTDEFKYLKLNVGKALRECIAEVILHQPADPIKYLAARLVKYRENIEMREKRAQEAECLNVEREIKIAEERAEAERLARELTVISHGGSEVTLDSNLVNYTSMHPESAGASTTF
ncbi:unnamed protein product [Leptidea sinapis]|uniref:Uncharacterized protein n=1 Tax=Leptidea sinapis TaxID=189913 RepID=A0A5E4R9B2_9NEOP|nr:unnamed protein product [Leptidea sinapis]